MTIARTGRFLIALLVLLFGAAAANAQQSAQPPAFTQQELDQILAPIALYPDSLLSQIMMAATYPREVTEAADWSRNNRDLNGDRAVRAVERYDWDPSVKSLVAFPQILAMMDEKINWTEDLGDAFLDQQAQVMDTVQYLRRQAFAAGNLRSSDQFRVDVRDGGFVIDFVNPEVAYLPYYNPVVVYGTWWWPTHQPVYWAPWPGYYTRTGYRGYAWGPPIRVSRGFFYGVPDWRQRRVNVVNVNNYYYRAPTSHRVDAPNPVAGAPHVWQHDTARRGAEPRRDATWRQRPRADANVRVDAAPRVEAAPDGRRDGRDRGAQYGNRGMPANAPATVAPPAQARAVPNPTPAAPSQPVVAAPAPNAPRAEPPRAAEARGRESRGNEARANRSPGNDGRGFEQRGERTQRHDPRFDSNRASQQPQQPAAAAPAARAPVAVATPTVAASTPPVAHQPRVAPASAAAPAAPVTGARAVDAKPAAANAPRAADAGRGDGRQGGSHERGGRPGSNDSTVAAGGNSRQRE